MSFVNRSSRNDAFICSTERRRPQVEMKPLERPFKLKIVSTPSQEKLSQLGKSIVEKNLQKRMMFC